MQDDERKFWVTQSAEGPRASCSDCAWNYPASGWGTHGPAAEEVTRFFEAHRCSEYPKSRPRVGIGDERRVRMLEPDSLLREFPVIKHKAGNG